MPKKYPKILVGSPVFDGKDYCIDEWIYQVKNIKYPNYDVLLTDNSKDSGKYAKYLTKKGINCIHVKRNAKSDIAALAECHDTLRQHALRHEYDYLFHLETDVFVPDTIITDLLTMKRKIASALYHVSLGNKSLLLAQLYEIMNSDNFNNVFRVNSDAIMFLDGSIKNGFHFGLGCILIHKSVLSKFKFRHTEGRDIYPDIFFAQDMAFAGEKIFCDTSIIAKHKNMSHGVFKIDFTA